MNKSDIKVGNWYNIKCNGNGSDLDYVGKAKCLAFNPLDYPEDAIEFECEDGINGVFMPKEVVSEAEAPLHNTPMVMA